MSVVFIGIYHFFNRRKWFFFLILAVAVGLIFWFGSKIRLEEDITRLNTDTKSLSRYEYVIRNFKFADKLVVHLSQLDTNATPNPELLISTAETLRDSLLTTLDSNYLKQIFLAFNDSLFGFVQKTIDEHLPVFLEEKDYKAIDSIMQPQPLEALLKDNFRILVSPASLVLQSRIVKDPLRISNMALAKFRSLQPDDQYILYNGCIISKDKKHLLMFITPANPSSETKKNSHLVSVLKKYCAIVGSFHPKTVNIEYYGYAATAVGNANQVKIDIILTLCIAIILIFFLVGWYFRNFRIPLLSFIPAFFGGGLGLVTLYLINGKISFIALGIGSVILGLIIDYALYLVNHYRKKKSVEQVLEDMSDTIIICSVTTIGVFLCLTLLNSNVLHDLGWFASISVLGASLSSLIILPQLFGKSLLPKEQGIERITFIDKIGSIDFGKNAWLLIGLAFAGVFSLVVTNKVAFENDLNSLNYMSESLKKAEKHLDEISRGGLKDVYVVSTGKSLNDALELNDISQKKLEMLKVQGVIHDYSGINNMFLSDSIQNERLHRWNEFWTVERKVKLLNLLENKGKQYGFNETAFSGIKSTLYTSYLPITKVQSKKLITVFFSDWINETPEMKMVSGIAKVPENEKQTVYKAFSGNPNVVVFDRQNLTTQFVLTVKRDFELLITLSMVFVTLLLLISFGRIELTIITSLPMYFSWLVTLGFMGVTGIKFNIFNIIISTFIFGLGVDYSILMMRGLLSQYKTGINDLKTYQVSILLSSATTIIGVGVLFIAKHPALSSIALISIVGIVSVVLISLSYQSMITHWLMIRPQESGIAPKTAYTILHSIFITWLPLSLILFFLVVYSHILNYFVPVSKKFKKDHFLRVCHFLSRFYIRMSISLHLDNEDQITEEFQKPAIILSSYQSILDIPIILGLHKKIILVANDRIMHHWLFGSVARLAGIIPCPISLTDSVTLMKQQADLGYSILIFPEMLTSKDRNIEQVNEDVDNISKLLNLDIVPVLIFGSEDRLPKGSFWRNPNRIFIRVLPGISATDPKFNSDYPENTETLQSYYHHEFLKFKDRNNTPAYNASKLMLNYIFKGPILEWYLRVKQRLEKDFSSYCELLPKSGEILDLGCGYGYISYMLKLTSDQRIITGVDYDEKKISIARHCYLKDDRISFFAADVMDYKITSKDGFLFGDVLHYLPFEKQEALLTECIRNLNPGGVILIREGNADNESRHKGTIFTEFLSISVFRFNKTQEQTKELYFTSSARLLSIAHQFGLNFEIIDQKKITSNTFFIMRMPMNPNSINSLT